MTVHVTSHAISRYRTRVAPVDYEAARAALSSPTIAKAAEFGAKAVKLGSGQRVLLNGATVVTVLPKIYHKACLRTERDRFHQERHQ